MPKISVSTTKNNSNSMRETRLLNYKQTLKESVRQNYRRRLKSELLLRGLSRRTKWRKQNATSRSRQIGKKTHKKLKPTFNIKFRLKRRGSKRSQTEVRELQKLWIAWLTLCTTKTKKCRPSRTETT